MIKVLMLAAVLILSACSDARDSRQAEVSASKEELGQMNRNFAAALNAGDAKAGRLAPIRETIA